MMNQWPTMMRIAIGQVSTQAAWSAQPVDASSLVMYLMKSAAYAQRELEMQHFREMPSPKPKATPMTNPTYTDEQVIKEIEAFGKFLPDAVDMLRSLLADRQRLQAGSITYWNHVAELQAKVAGLQAEVEALRSAISKKPQIDAYDMHWFEPAFSAWSCGDIEGAVDGLSSAVNSFMPSMPDCSNLSVAVPAFPRAIGVSRDAECKASLSVFFDRQPNDDEMRAFHDYVAARATPNETKEAKS